MPSKSRNRRSPKKLARRMKTIATASCDALGEAASALSRTAPDFHLGSPTSTVLQLYPLKLRVKTGTQIAI